MADPWYQVHASRAVADGLRELQKQASRQGRGEEFLDAVRQIHEELQNRPMVFGEALYRLPALGMSVRTRVGTTSRCALRRCRRSTISFHSPHHPSFTAAQITLRAVRNITHRKTRIHFPVDLPQEPLDRFAAFAFGQPSMMRNARNRFQSLIFSSSESKRA